MNILVVGKIPPIQGGVSTYTTDLICSFARSGHVVHVVTNAFEVDNTYKQMMSSSAVQIEIESQFKQRIFIYNTSDIRNNCYVPFSNPFLSKIFGLCLSILKKNKIDVIYAPYLEPYGLAASLVGKIEDVPVVLRHAGTDVSRLLQHPDLQEAYRWAFKNARGVLSNTNSPPITDAFRQQDISLDNFVRLKTTKIPNWTSNTADAFLLEKWIGLSERFFEQHPFQCGNIIRMNSQFESDNNSSSLKIGFFGKISPSKCFIEIVDAVNQLIQVNLDVRVLCCVGGDPSELRRFFDYVASFELLAGKMVVLPLLAPWDIVKFMKECDIVCALEHEFPIKIHQTNVPREILSSGRCLFLSQELYRKQRYRKNLSEGVNYIQIENPRDRRKLASRFREFVLDREKCRYIGQNGKYLSEFIENELPSSTAVVDQIKDLSTRLD